MAKINVKHNEVTIIKIDDVDYISLTDIAKTRDSRSEIVIQNWIRSRMTIELLGLWETLNNPNFKHIEFDVFKKQAGLNAFILSPKQWIEKTNAIGIVSKSGKYGGTFAHRDIAFEFASWLSVEFKLYLVKEFQRLKEEEQKQLGWSAKREYCLNCDFHKIIMIHLITIILLINKIIKIKVQTTNMENINAVLINENVSQKERLIRLNQIAIQQMRVLNEVGNRKMLN